MQGSAKDRGALAERVKQGSEGKEGKDRRMEVVRERGEGGEPVRERR